MLVFVCFNAGVGCSGIRDIINLTPLLSTLETHGYLAGGMLSLAFDTLFFWGFFMLLLFVNGITVMCEENTPVIVHFLLESDSVLTTDILMQCASFYFIYLCTLCSIFSSKFRL